MGHLISGEGMYPLKEKVGSLVHLVPPTDVTETRHITGLIYYYRKFIANFSDVMRPLNELTRTNTLFVWSPWCQFSFDTIKIILTNSPILVFPKSKLRICVLY